MSKKAAKESSGGFREWTKTIVVAVVLFVLIRSFLLQTFVITSGSMKETLLVGDMIVVNRVALGSPIPLVGGWVPGYSAPHRGDILVFQAPPRDPVQMTLVKRLVGVPGDTLQMRSGVLYVDGKAQVEPYIKRTPSPDVTDGLMDWQKEYLVGGVDPATYTPTRDNWGPLVIPADSYFMMGDNREESEDSRYWGLVDRRLIDGRPMFIYFSYNGESYRPFPWLREINWGRIGRTLR